MKQLFSILLVVAVVVVGAIAQAQQSKKVSRIGYRKLASPVPLFGTRRGIPAGVARAWLRRG